jgi:hypothetical protein
VRKCIRRTDLWIVRDPNPRYLLLDVEVMESVHKSMMNLYEEVVGKRKLLPILSLQHEFARLCIVCEGRSVFKREVLAHFWRDHRDVILIHIRQELAVLDTEKVTSATVSVEL